MEQANFTVLSCPNCRQRLRLPNDKGELAVTCPKCHNRCEYSPAVLRSTYFRVGMPELVSVPTGEANEQLAAAYFRCISPYATGLETYKRIEGIISKCQFDFVGHFRAYGSVIDCEVSGLGEQSISIINEILEKGVELVYERVSSVRSGNLMSCGVANSQELARHEVRTPDTDGQWDNIVRAKEEQ